MAHKRVKTALIGSGTISGIYLQNTTKVLNNILDVVGCSDIIPERAQRRAEQFGIRAMTNEEILNDPEIELVINTTFMKAHFEVSKQILEAGKNLHTEKCLSLTCDMAKELIDLAKAKGLNISGAPDTFLGAGMQTAIKLIDDGFVGIPRACTGIMVRGFDMYGFMKRAPFDFDILPGTGVLHDVGVYYVAAMIAMFGPIKRVAGTTHQRVPEITFENPDHPRYGQTKKLEEPQVITATLEFQNGVLGTLICTNDGPAGEIPILDVFGSEAHLYAGDPDMYHGPVFLAREGTGYNAEKQAIQLTHGFSTDSRGIGVADAAYAIRNHRKPRCDGEFIYHTLEALWGIIESSKTDEYYVMKSTCERPKPVASGVKKRGAAFDD